MKFLFAAVVMCLALVGQSRAGSLRGFTVPVPHRVYGVPVLDNEIHIEETQPIVADKESVSVEEPIVSQPSTEYGAPAVAHEIETLPFVGTLPLVDSIVSFGTPSETYGSPAKPTTPKPELPYLEPGLPTLPEAPVVPEVAKVNEEYRPSTEYGAPAVAHEIETVPFVGTLPLVDSIESFGIPSETYGAPAKPTTPKPELPYLEPGLPTLPEAPVVPVVPSEEFVEVSNEYLPPVGGTTSVVEEYMPSTDEAPLPPATAEIPLPTIHEIPALPEAPATSTPAVTVEHSGQYFYEHPAIGFPTPISHIPQLPATTFILAEGTPAHEEHKTSELFGAANVQVHIPEFPAVPVTTFAAENTRPSEVYELPEPSLPEVPAYIAPAVRDVKTVPVEATKEYFYEPPAVAFPTPLTAQPILPEIKTLAAEKPRQYFYDVPAKAFPTPVTVPIAQGIVSHSGFVQSSASSSSSSSSLHVNKYAVPLTIQPHTDSVVVEELTPLGPAFAIHSVTGSSENTSTGQFNQVSVVNHLVPHLSSFGTVVGLHQPVTNSVPVPVPHGAYGVANF